MTDETFTLPPPFHCDTCGLDAYAPAGSLGTGYGVDDKGRKCCYQCCAKVDADYMREHGRMTLYLDASKRKVSNWPGSLAFTTGAVRKGRHNIAGVQYDTWFMGPDNTSWHAVQYGDNTQIAHCKRVKRA